MKSIIFWSYVLLLIFSCKSQEKKDFNLNDIIEIDHPYTKGDTNGKQIINNKVVYPYREQYFIIQNFGNYNDTLIKEFALSTLNQSDTIYSTRVFYFFKPSKYTNIEHLKKTPRDIDRHSAKNDLIYNFTKITGEREGFTLTRH